MKYVENFTTQILCPECGQKLIIKTNRHTDHQFLGCPNFPECTYTRGIPEEWKMREQGQPGLFDEIETGKAEQ